jgi:hypothetical protein
MSSECECGVASKDQGFNGSELGEQAHANEQAEVGGTSADGQSRPSSRNRPLDR